MANFDVTRCDVTDDVISVVNTFTGMICNVFFISDVKMNLTKIYRNFQNGRHFEVRASFYTESCTGSWVLHPGRQCHSLHFEFLIDALAQILTELGQFQILTYIVTAGPNYLTFDLQTVQVIVLGQTTYGGEIWRRLIRNYELYCGKYDNFI